jgi:DNA repair protein RecN (Recombination protein N)
MLDQLQITNLALIDQVTLSFSKGLNILSGETGAGKSIIIKAVNLLLGEKPSPDTIRQGAKEARVEALFSIPDDRTLRHLLSSQGLPSEEQVLITRTIQDNGKSRAWINGGLTNQSVLGRVTRLLIGISNQHEYQSLLNPVQHLFLLDRFAGLLALRESVQTQFELLETQIKALQELTRQEQERKRQKELWLFQAQEIQQADLRPGEDLELQQRRKVLQQAEKIWEKVHLAGEALSEGDHSCLTALSMAKDLLRSAAAMDPSLQPQFQELETLQWQLSEISSGLQGYLSHLVFDPQILEQVEERLDRIQRLTAKYGPTVEAVLDYGAQVEKNLKEGEDLVLKKKELEEQIKTGRQLLYETSLDLSGKRKEASLELSTRVESELKGLGMAGCRFQIVFSPAAEEGEAGDDYRHKGAILNRTGIEKGEFYIAPNVGEGLRPLARIASGGELSRILLVLKGLLSDQDSLETLIFDEVDSGIGGSLGEAVGRKLNQLSQTHQIICITHLPQIAVFAETHFRVSKETRTQRTQTKIHLLQENDQVEEIARMLGGPSSSTKTVSMAKEMLSGAKKQMN